MSNICTIGIVGLVSASLIALVGYPVFFESIEFTMFTIPMIIFAALVGSVLFGSGIK